jgi:hypothetical protein
MEEQFILAYDLRFQCCQLVLLLLGLWEDRNITEDSQEAQRRQEGARGYPLKAHPQ